MKERKEDVREDFCGPCLMMIPAALGLGGTAVGSSAKGNRKMKKRVPIFDKISKEKPKFGKPSRKKVPKI